MAKPVRTFTGSVGVKSVGTAGPESLKTDIGNAMAMFDPAKTLSDGSAGGISAENLNADVATQAELDAHTVLTTGVHGAVSANTASKLIIRDASARAQVADPSATQDIATKNYVDTVVAASDVTTHAALTTAHGAVSTATAGKMVVRDGSGRAAFADPAAAGDAATKSYVDASVGYAVGATTWRSFTAPLYIAHRGQSGSFPENTLPAFAATLPYPATQTVCEMDVVIAKDGVPIVCHDLTLTRTTNGTGNVADTYLTELRQLDAGSDFGARFAGTRLPTLDEALACAYGLSGRLVMLDQKATSTALATLLAGYVVDGGLQDRVALVSERDADIATWKAIDATIYAVKIETAAPNIAALAAAGVDAINLHYPVMTAAIITNAHAAGMEVFVWGDWLSGNYYRDLAVAAGADGVVVMDLAYATKVHTAGSLPWSDDWGSINVLGTGYVHSSIADFDDRFHVSTGGYIGKKSGTVKRSGVTLGFLPLSSGVQIDFTITPRVLNADTSRHCGIWLYCDADYMDPNVWLAVSARRFYGIFASENGQIRIERKRPNEDPTVLANLLTPGVMVVDTPIPCRIVADATGITFTRLDSGLSVTTADTTYRDGWIMFYFAQMAVEFSDVTITAA